MSEQDTTIDEFIESPDKPNQDKSELITGVAWSGISSLPEDWTANNLESNISITTGNNFSSDYFVDEGGIPLVRIRDIDTGDTTVNYTGEYDEEYLVQDFDLLVGMDGEFEPHFWSGGNALLNQRVCRIEPDKTYNRIFLRYALEKPLWYIQKSIAGTTVKHLSQSNIRDINLPTPSLEEQRKIASVLHTIDQAIQKTEQIVDQLKRVKLGVSQHYFEDYDTIRRDENPESVQMVELSNLVEFKPGKAWKTDNLSDDGMRVVRISNLTGEKDEYWQYNDDYEERRVIEDGDLLFSWAGMRSSIGVHIYRGERALLNQHIYNLIPTSDISRKYLYYYLDYRMSDLYSLSQGGAVQIHLTKDIIERILIPELDASERDSIVAHLSEIDNAIRNEMAQKNQLRRLKQGLMQDLLSGEVRTHDKDIEPVDDVLQYG
jgi:type I restriction enzyme S subunit